MIYDITLSEEKFDIVSSILRVEIGQSVKALQRGGFQNLWKVQVVHAIMLDAKNLTQKRKPSDYISKNTLSPFFNVVGVTMITLGMVFITENLSDEGVRMRLWNRAINFSIFVKMYVRLACRKLYFKVGKWIEGVGGKCRKKYDKNGCVR